MLASCVGRSSEPVFVTRVSQAVKLNCVRLKLGWADEQLFAFETVEDIFKGIFVLLNGLREYGDVVKVYPHLDADPIPEHVRHEPLPRQWSIAIPLLEGIADISSQW